MVTVQIKRQNKRIVSFTVSGHAVSGPYGHDLVCAGVSAVSFGTVNAIEKLCGIQLSVDMEGDGGYLHCVVPTLQGKADEQCQWLLEGMAVSIQSITEEYGQYIQLEQQGGV